MRPDPITLPIPVSLVLAAVVLLGTGACGDAGDETDDPAADTVAATDTAGPAADRGSDRLSYPELRRAVCDTLTNSFECARAIESGQLEGEARGVRRSGDTLHLALASDDTARLVDRRGDHSRVAYYSYQYRWPDTGHYLVQRQHYEGSRYLLVDDRSGEQTVLADWPLRSPDGGRFAVLSFDLVAGYGPNILQIWRVDDGTPTREWETEPSDWGPTDGRWLGPTRLSLTQRGDCGDLGVDGSGMCDRPATLSLDGEEWRLETGETGEVGDGH